MDLETAINAEHEYQKGIIEYYSEAGMDYEPWSRRFNMHFGYFRPGLNPFDREQLLDEMSLQTIKRLKLDHSRPNKLVESGPVYPNLIITAGDHFFLQGGGMSVV